MLGTDTYVGYWVDRGREVEDLLNPAGGGIWVIVILLETRGLLQTSALLITNFVPARLILGLALLL